MFVVGFATEEEIRDLEAEGYEVEDATKFSRVVGPEPTTLTRAPTKKGTRAIVCFLDASVYDVLDDVFAGHIDCHPGTDDPEGHPGVDESEDDVDASVRWPELPSDEEFLRIVLLESRTMGKDVTVEPYKSWVLELAWRRTDKYAILLEKRPLNVEQVLERKNEYIRMEQAFRNQQYLMDRLLQNHLCSHKRADGSDYTVGVPASGERWCAACTAQFY